MAEYKDGPGAAVFGPLDFRGGTPVDAVAESGVSDQMKEALGAAPTGNCVCWGIPFRADKVVLLRDEPVVLDIKPAKVEWVVFMHTSDLATDPGDRAGAVHAGRGPGRLGEHAADYVVVYEDGEEARIPVRRRFEIGMFQRRWGENCARAVAHRKPHPVPAHHEQTMPGWGRSQTRVSAADDGPWTSWLFAWENRKKSKAIRAIRLEPVEGTVVLSAISCGSASSNPLQWLPRRKALLRLPKDVKFDPTLNENGLLSQVQLDMGQVISAQRKRLYPDSKWAVSAVASLPGISEDELVVEYAAHPDASFHLPKVGPVAVSRLKDRSGSGPLRPVREASRRVRIQILDKDSRTPVAVRLHIHGEAGEYLPPLDRHRIPNPAWFEDYAADLPLRNAHYSAYVPGETEVKLPLGPVYVEICKGCEIKPVRKVVRVGRNTSELVFEIEKVLPWREKGWVTADTHVHFLSPQTALLEGEAEGVNVVNLLASQWGELMTNAGDFDGRTTWGSEEAGGSGEWLVRVGTENRQHVMGHISLLGYEGPMITPMTTGGPDESAIGDAVEVLLTEWARKCREQNGVVILPHFPDPRLENAAAIVEGEVDGVEMTSGTGGISPYSLLDWYRYLNCGYLVPAVGGTDKMQAGVPVGANRTYARIRRNRKFTYQAWKEAVRNGETFVTCGPLMEMNVDGRAVGSRISMTESGGTVDVSWELASVVMPMTRAELVVNGEVREGRRVRRTSDKGSWRIKVDRSSWIALLVRADNSEGVEVIAAHSTPVMVEVKGSEFLAAADAFTILEQIEGALAYLDTVGTRAENKAYKRMRLVLTTAYRSLHNRMHKAGLFHDHSHATDHDEHHRKERF